MKKAVLLVLGFALASVSQGISERDYAQNYTSKVVPHFRAATVGKFRGQDKLNIAYLIQRATPSRGKVVLVPGFSETYLKYAELAYDLNQLGYSVYLIDHRGQGLSDRKVANTQIIHVEDFNYYVDDLETFVRSYVKTEHRDEPLYIIGHSMGGWISAKLLARQPKWFKGAALVTPMFRIDSGKIPRFLARRVASAACRVGKGKQFALGYGQVDLASEQFVKAGTHSRVRWEKNIEIGTANPVVIPGGPSYNWVRLALKETLRYRIKKMAEKVTTPSLVFEAGQDARVSPYGIELFCKNTKDCSRVVYPDSYHGVLHETDSIRDHAIAKIHHFFEAQ